MRNLAHATSLTGEGLRDFLIQRITSVIMAVYILFLTGFFIAKSPIDFFTWQTLFAHPAMKIGSTIFLLSLMWHAWIGIWTVLTDYIKCAAGQLILQTLVIIALLAEFIWGVSILWSV